MMAIIRSERNFLMMLFCVAFMLRLLIFFTVTRHNDNAWMLPDSKQYHIVADNIARGNGFVNVHGNPQMLRLPGYPIFLAGLYVLLHHDVYKTLLIQIFLSCFIPLCIFLLGLVLFPSQILIARIAGLIAALHIGFGIYAGMLTTETLFLIFFLVFLILFFTYCNPSCDQIYAFKKRMLKSDEGSLSRVSFRTHGTLLQFFLIGVLAGLTSLIRPVGVYIMFISLAIMFVSMPFKQWLKKAGTFGIAWLMTIAPWVIRNFLLTGAIFFPYLAR